MKAKLVIFGLILILVGCATPTHRNLEKVQLGMDKTQVLDLAGNPKRTVRRDDGDLWTFVYYVGNQHYERDVRFSEGHVAVISVAREVNPPAAQGEAVLNDYENLVQEAESKRASKSETKIENKSSTKAKSEP